MIAVRALGAKLASHRYGELEKKIERERDPARRAFLVRESNRLQRGRS